MIVSRERAIRTVNECYVTGRVDGVGDLIRKEPLQIRKVGEFLQISCERDCVLFRSSWDVTDCVIVLLQLASTLTAEPGTVILVPASKEGEASGAGGEKRKVVRCPLAR
jgi:hypothetical protein